MTFYGSASYTHGSGASPFDRVFSVVEGKVASVLRVMDLAATWVPKGCLADVAPESSTSGQGGGRARVVGLDGQC